MMEDCIFCKIIAGEIPSEKVYEGDDIIAFRDINPVAKTHIQIIPSRHIPTIADVSDTDMPLIGEMIKVANELAKSEGVAESGYRLVINCGKESGMEVFHLHLHLIGGRQLGPMG
ncbi:histidine triad nucleotide-binding protein [Chloroflexota bacterium]